MGWRSLFLETTPVGRYETAVLFSAAVNRSLRLTVHTLRMAAHSPIEDRRRSQRLLTLLTGRICYGESASISLPCVIRNLSPEGALLIAAPDAPIPKTFALLHIPQGVSYDARLTWRIRDRVGVELGDRHDLKGAVEVQLKALRGIWMALAPR
jgi:hypothetical protein